MYGDRNQGTIFATMIDHERLFKELLSNFFPEFIELFFPIISTYWERESIEFLPQEIFTDVTEREKNSRYRRQS